MAWIVGTIMLQGLEPGTNQISRETCTAFGRMEGDGLVGLSGLLLGQLALTSIAVAAIRGRVSSVMMRDVAAMAGPG